MAEITPQQQARIDEIDAEIKGLIAKMRKIENTPANQLTGGLHKYTPNARKRLDKIGWDITHLTTEKRKLSGRPVSADGYSGRNSNRR